MRDHLEEIKKFANKLHNTMIVSDVCDVLDEVCDWYKKKKECEETTAISFTLHFLYGISCGDQMNCKDGETSWFILSHDTIANMFVSRHGFESVYK